MATKKRKTATRTKKTAAAPSEERPAPFPAFRDTQPEILPAKQVKAIQAKKTCHGCGQQLESGQHVCHGCGRLVQP